MEIKYIKDIEEKEVLNLYEDAQWHLYTKDMPSLMKGIQNSLDVISLWEDNHMIGLIRTVGDGETILYIQDILILEAYQRKGHGTKLLKMVLDTYKHVRMKVLLTDQSEKTRLFYESLGFLKSDDLKTQCFLRNNI